MNIIDIRKNYPEYDDLSDAEIARAFHKNYYSDMPVTSVFDAMGVKPERVDEIAGLQARQEELGPRTGARQALGDFGAGVVQGLAQTAQGAGRLYAQAGEALGIPGADVVDERLAQKIQQSQNKVDALRGTSPKMLGVTTAGAGEFTGAVAPFVALPASAPTLAGRVGLGAVGGAIGGATAPEAEDLGERAGKAGVYGTVGGALPVGVAGVVGGAKAVGNISDILGSSFAKYSDIVAGKIDETAARELASQGIDVTRLTASTDETGKTFINNYLRNTVLGGGKVAKAGERVQGQVEGAFEKIVGKGDDPVQAGIKLQKGLKEAEQAFFDKSAKLYNDVAQRINPKAPVFARETVRVLDDIGGSLKGTELGEAIGGAKLKAFEKIEDIVTATRKNLSQGKLTYPRLKEARTEVGKILRATPKTSDAYGQYAKLYGAMSDDMFKAAEEFGGDALTLAREANNFYKSGIEEIKFLDQSFGGSKLAEDAFQAAVSNLQNKGQRLDRLLSSIPQKERLDVIASVLNRLGQQGASPETFNVMRFSTNFKKLSPAARKALFNGNEKFAEDVATLVKNIDRVRPLIEQAPRTGEKTAGVLSDVVSGGLVSGALFVNPAFLVPAVVKGLMDVTSANILTKPIFVKAVNQASKAKTRAGAVKVLDGAISKTANKSTKLNLERVKKALLDQRGSFKGIETTQVTKESK